MNVKYKYGVYRKKAPAVLMLSVRPTSVMPKPSPMKWMVFTRLGPRDEMLFITPVETRAVGRKPVPKLIELPNVALLKKTYACVPIVEQLIAFTTMSACGLTK